MALLKHITDCYYTVIVEANNQIIIKMEVSAVVLVVVTLCVKSTFLFFINTAVLHGMLITALSNII